MRRPHSIARLTCLSAVILVSEIHRVSASPRYIETVGIGRADPALINVTQRHSTACEAAIIQAQAKMLSKIQSSGPLKGAEVVRTEWLRDDRCRVTLRLDKTQSKEE